MESNIQVLKLTSECFDQVQKTVVLRVEFDCHCFAATLLLAIDFGADFHCFCYCIVESVISRPNIELYLFPTLWILLLLLDDCSMQVSNVVRAIDRFVCFGRWKFYAGKNWYDFHWFIFDVFCFCFIVRIFSMQLFWFCFENSS